MNRYPLNSVTLGSGNTRPWITAASEQALQIVGALTGGITKYGSAAGELALSGALHVIRRVSVFLEGALELMGSAAASVHTNQYFSCDAPLQVVVAGDGCVMVSGAGYQFCSLNYSATARTLVTIHGTGSGDLALAYSATGVDVPTGPAPDERVTGVVQILPQTSADVVLGGA